MSDLLKPCPFCGPGGSIVTVYEDEYGYWTVGCGRCGSHSGKRPKKVLFSRQMVIDLWNQRPMENQHAETGAPNAN